MNYSHEQFADADQLAEGVASRWLELIVQRDEAKPFTVALSGGRFPRAYYKALAKQAVGVAFRNVHFFWGDERVVPPADEESNFKLAAVPLLLALKIPDEQVHRVLTERDEAFAVTHAEAEICRIADLDTVGQPIVDLVLLGMGEDGHVASLFPGDEASDSTAVYRAVTGPKPPPRRITLGYPALAAAREVWVVLSGDGKADTLAAAMEPDSDLPIARVLRSRTHTRIFTDFDFA